MQVIKCAIAFVKQPPFLRQSSLLLLLGSLGIAGSTVYSSILSYDISFRLERPVIEGDVAEVNETLNQYASMIKQVNEAQYTLISHLAFSVMVAVVGLWLRVLALELESSNAS